MKWEWTIGRIGQTQIRLHASLLLLLLYVIWQAGLHSLRDLFWALALVTGIFICVALYEIGHILAAQLFGVEVTSITLWLMGGIALMKNTPNKPWQDLIIALCGPLVNLLLAIGFGMIILSRGLYVQQPHFWRGEDTWNYQLQFFLSWLTIANLSLFVFNLLPVFPLDGGRVTQNILHILFGKQRANKILFWISMPLAFILLAVAIGSGEWALGLISLLLIFGSSTLNFSLRRQINLALAYLVNRGAYYQLRGDYDRAIQQYTHLLQKKPNLADLYLARGLLYLYLEDMQSSRADLERALQLNADNPMCWLMRGELYEVNGDYDRALDYYERAIRLKPDWGLPYADRGGIHRRNGNLQQAMSDLNKAVELAPDFAILYLLRAMLRFELGDRQGAQADENRALELSQDIIIFPEIFLRNFVGQLDWALSYYTRLIEKMPLSPLPYQGRADVLRVNQQYERAIIDYTKAIGLSPTSPLSFLGRGLAHHALGQLEQALADFKVAYQHATQSHLQRRLTTLIQNGENQKSQSLSEGGNTLT